MFEYRLRWYIKDRLQSAEYINIASTPNMILQAMKNLYTSTNFNPPPKLNGRLNCYPIEEYLTLESKQRS